MRCSNWMPVCPILEIALWSSRRHDNIPGRGLVRMIKPASEQNVWVVFEFQGHGQQQDQDMEVIFKIRVYQKVIIQPDESFFYCAS
jgi:hypothetical protein